MWAVVILKIVGAPVLRSAKILCWKKQQNQADESVKKTTLKWAHELIFYSRYMEPITKGEYPRSMQSLVGNRLPKFSEEQSGLLKGSFDFLGLNYYSSFYAAHAPHLHDPSRPSLQTDSLVNVTSKNSIM